MNQENKFTIIADRTTFGYNGFEAFSTPYNQDFSESVVIQLTTEQKVTMFRELLVWVSENYSYSGVEGPINVINDASNRYYRREMIKHLAKLADLLAPVDV